MILKNKGDDFLKNPIILQGFEWYLPEDGQHWKKLISQTKEFKELGFTGIWLPPAYKGANGIHDVGYGTYDLYDLGEFEQKGSTPTKYGSKDDYLQMIQQLHEVGIEAYGDIVFDHFLGADESELVEASKYAWNDRRQQIGAEEKIEAWTKFNFPGRAKKYNDYQWSWKNFNGVDYDSRSNDHAIFGFEGKNWNAHVDSENGNYDYLMGADLDMDYTETVDQLDKWGNWYQELTQIDGYRLDAVKHIQFSFYIEWLKKRQIEHGKSQFVVGEYWSDEVSKLTDYLDACGGMMSLFDVPLHFNLLEASSSNGSYDMRNILEGTLMQARPEWATTFVDNHDTQPGQSLQSWIEGWFKVCAYAFILLKDCGTPVIFYGDLYGIPHDDIDPVGKELRILLKVRELLAYGDEMDYIDHPDIIGWTRFGTDELENSGLAFIMTNATGGEKEMCVGAFQSGETFVDCLGNREEKIVIGADGCAIFPVNDGSCSVYINEKMLEKVSE